MRRTIALAARALQRAEAANAARTQTGRIIRQTSPGREGKHAERAPAA
jgi:hypothetical protein